jgi:hypothetical protein
LLLFKYCSEFNLNIENEILRIPYHLICFVDETKFSAFLLFCFRTFLNTPLAKNRYHSETLRLLLLLRRNYRSWKLSARKVLYLTFTMIPHLHRQWQDKYTFCPKYRLLKKFSRWQISLQILTIAHRRPAFGFPESAYSLKEYISVQKNA